MMTPADVELDSNYFLQIHFFGQSPRERAEPILCAIQYPTYDVCLTERLTGPIAFLFPLASVR